MVYGESVSMLLILSLLNWFVANDSQNGRCSWELSAFLMGLLTLTKFPLMFLSVLFLVVLLRQYWNERKSVQRMLLMIVLFFVPSLIFRMFQMKYNVVVSSVGSDWTAIFGRFWFPNTDMLKRVVAIISTDADNLWYYFWIAAALSIFSFQHWRYGWTIALWILFLIIYYAYVYGYELLGASDYASGLRYFLPVASGFLFLGSYGLGNLVDALHKNVDQRFWPLLYVLYLGVVFYKLF